MARRELGVSGYDVSRLKREYEMRATNEAQHAKVIRASACEWGRGGLYRRRVHAHVRGVMRENACV